MNRTMLKVAIKKQQPELLYGVYAEMEREICCYSMPHLLDGILGHGCFDASDRGSRLRAVLPL